MKKKLVIAIVVLIIVVFVSFIAYSNYKKEKESITGETVTGEATDSNFAVTATVSVENPTVNIVLPENETYITNKSLRLNFTSAVAHTIWYNLDNGANTTLTGNTTFNATQGQHTLYLFANNTDNANTSDSVTFTVNISKFSVKYSEYAGLKKGLSTAFNQSSHEDLQNLSNIILENIDWGRIQFYNGINVTNDADTSDNKVDFDNNTNISENRIELNSTALPNFNQSATIYLYNLTFSNPRPLRDGSVCPSTICTEISYNQGTGTFIFNVTQFTVYSAEETPSAPTQPSGGGGGGGVVSEKNFRFSSNDIRITMKENELIKKSVTIINTGSEKLNIVLEAPALNDIMSINETAFNLGPGRSKLVILAFNSENIEPELYIGRLIAKANGLEKSALVSVEIESGTPLFDVKTSIVDKFRYVLPGEETAAKVELFNLERKDPTDVYIDYIIRDENGNEIYRENESLRVDTQTSFVKLLKIPEKTEFGRYVLYIRTLYKGKIASASAWFNVGERPLLTLKNVLWAIIIVLVTILVIAIILRRKFKKLKETYGIDKYLLKKEGLIK